MKKSVLYTFLSFKKQLFNLSIKIKTGDNMNSLVVKIKVGFYTI